MPYDQTLIKPRIWFGFRTLQESGMRKKLQETVCNMQDIVCVYMLVTKAQNFTNSQRF